MLQPATRSQQPLVSNPQPATPSQQPAVSNLIAYKPLEILAICFTSLEKSSDGCENVLIMTDIFIKITQVVPCKGKKATTVAKILVKDWFVKFGIPARIHSDQGRNVLKFHISRTVICIT